MEIPFELKNRINELAENKSVLKLKDKALRLSQLYSQSNKTNTHFISDELDAFVYAASRMPATYAAIRFALEKTLEVYPTNIDSILDIGSGTGASVWAYQDIKKTLPKTTCIEQEQNMISIGMKLLEECDFKNEVFWIKNNYLEMNDFGESDLVIAAYTINENFQKIPQNLIKNLYFAAKKIFLIVEPGTPDGYKQIIKIRDELLLLGAHIIAPCCTENKCLLSSDDWCNFSTRISRTKLHKELKGGDAPFEDEKFIFLAVAHNNVTNNKGRILRHPLIGGNCVSLKCCTNDGIKEIKVYKSNKEQFKRAKKSECGELFDYNL